MYIYRRSTDSQKPELHQLLKPADENFRGIKFWQLLQKYNFPLRSRYITLAWLNRPTSGKSECSLAFELLMSLISTTAKQENDEYSTARMNKLATVELIQGNSRLSKIQATESFAPTVTRRDICLSQSWVRSLSPRASSCATLYRQQLRAAGASASTSSNYYISEGDWFVHFDPSSPCVVDGAFCPFLPSASPSSMCV